MPNRQDNTQRNIQVVALCGSLRPNSYTRMALACALQGAADAGADTELLDLRAYDLCFCDGSPDLDRWPDDVATLRKKVEDAQGIILGTPEYHGSFSGVLKNALDLMGFEQFEGKMMGLVGVAGGAMGAMNSLTALRTVGRTLRAWVVPTQVSIASVWKHFDDMGRPTDEKMELRLREVGRQVARFAFLHSSQHAWEFVSAWEDAQQNPGGGG